MTRPGSKQVAMVGAALVAVTLAVFSGALSGSFLNYDDDVYVTDNPQVAAGLRASGVAWAFRSTDAANWHPVTWLSHMADVTLFGMDAPRHHLTSVALHAANVALLFLLLLRMTGALWSSAFAAALFALHPLHVESVAWIAERKDVLSTFFWFLTTAAWLRYVTAKSAARYTLVVVCFALGLMAKPMLVTLPLTLMLWDAWPLRRAVFPPLWKEKLPLLAMAAASCVVTLVAQHRGGTIQSFAHVSLPARVANAAVGYAWYLEKTFWPSALACFYPHPGVVRAGPALASALILAGVTALAWRLRRRAPFVAFGWAWFLVTLFPVIGLVQVGGQAVADRYTYIPLIGLFVALSFGLAALAGESPGRRTVLSACAATALGAIVPVTRAQVSYWNDNTSLFRRALAVTRDNALAQNNLGLALAETGKLDQAESAYREALRIKPDYVEALSNLGGALHRQGRYAEALEPLRRALAGNPDSPGVRVNLGNSLLATGKVDDALTQYTEALRLRPDFYDAHQNLGLVLDRLGRSDEAIRHFASALDLRPNDPAPHLGLASALASSGRLDDAIREFETVAKLRPDFPEAYNAWGAALAGRGRNAEALDRYDNALRLKPDFAVAQNNAGLALAALGRLPEAIERFQRAVAASPGFAQAHGNLGVALAQLNRLPEAIEQLEEAVRLDPGLTQARDNLQRIEGTRH